MARRWSMNKHLANPRRQWNHESAGISYQKVGSSKIECFLGTCKVYIYISIYKYIYIYIYICTIYIYIHTYTWHFSPTDFQHHGSWLMTQRQEGSGRHRCQVGKEPGRDHPEGIQRGDTRIDPDCFVWKILQIGPHIVYIYIYISIVYIYLSIYLYIYLYILKNISLCLQNCYFQTHMKLGFPRNFKPIIYAMDFKSLHASLARVHRCIEPQMSCWHCVKFVINRQRLGWNIEIYIDT